MTDTIFGTPAASDSSPAIVHHATPASEAKPVRLSLLDELAAEAGKEITETVRYAIDNRPGWSAEFTTTIESTDFKRYQKNAQGKKKNAVDADPIIFSGQPLVERNTGIFKNDEAVLDGDGDNLVFGSIEFRAMFPASTSAVDAARLFIGDGKLIAMGNALYTQAGYGEEATQLDPTNA
ncbi:hypothetical protein ACQCSX_04460 [Pseudarthrobacter sp. P1]|uniref:hypothetical protein n=1 Tax=Pseudarthrobacter sp. P1 TaxID=3418418 RepID=UPI003CE785AC